MIKMNTN